MAFTEKDKLKALAIVNIFETGKAFGDYAALAVLDDGAGISYGISQFTHKSDSLAAVIERYFALGGIVGRAVVETRGALLRKNTAAAIGSLAADETFKKALRSAAITHEMREAQNQIGFELYLKPAIDVCGEKGFTLPLSLAVVYDSVTHGSWKKIAEKLRPEVGETWGRGEKDWMAEYIQLRDKWLASAPRLKKTRYRTAFFLNQINAGNWDLELPFTVHGVELLNDTFVVNATVNMNAELPRGKEKIKTVTESIQQSLAGMSEIEIKENYSVDPTTRPAEKPPETQPGSPETDRPQKRAVPANPPDQKAVGSSSRQKGVSLDRLEERVNAAAAKYDQAERIVNTVITRKDAAKSLWTTVVGTIWQTVWAITGFLLGMPRVVWLVVAVIAGALMIGYLYRQIALGRIRETETHEG